jgi:hypothetical protein
MTFLIPPKLWDFVRAYVWYVRAPEKGWTKLGTSCSSMLLAGAIQRGSRRSIELLLQAPARNSMHACKFASCERAIDGWIMHAYSLGVWWCCVMDRLYALARSDHPSNSLITLANEGVIKYSRTHLVALLTSPFPFHPLHALCMPIAENGKMLD